MTESLTIASRLKRIRRRLGGAAGELFGMPASVRRSRTSLETVNSAYARWAPVYDTVFSLPLSFGRRAAVAEANRHSGRVLEVGVGTGLSLPAYGSQLSVTGIDVSKPMLARAQRRIATRRLDRVEALMAMDASAMGFADGGFDLAVVMYVMSVVPDPAAVLREIERVVRPGGTVIVVNHFSADHGIFAVAERLLARWGKSLGWDPLFPKSNVVSQTRMTLIDERPIAPFGLFTLMVFRR